MKIAILHYHNQVHSRGAETFVQELSKRLKQKNQLKVLSHPHPFFSSRTRLSLLNRLYLDRSSLLIGIWTLQQLSRLTTFNPDVIFSLNGGWQILILRIYSCLKGKKLLVSAQSGPGWDDRFNLLCAPDVFICLTRTQLNWAKTKAFHWPNQRFAVIPNGADLDEFKPSGSKAKLNLITPIILLVAASESNKRVEQGIKAVAQLKNASLLLLGSGADDEKINNLGATLLGEGRFLHLSVPHPKINKYYRSVDLFTLCSQSSEAFGIVYLEALASNLAVVATDDPSRREIIGNAGLFVKDPDNATQYASILKTALKKKWGKLPRQQAFLFSWDKINKQYQELFEDL